MSISAPRFTEGHDQAADHGAAMDRMYGVQRHIYDASRRYYLLGRDQLIAELRPPAGGSVLEVGCGTGRNLVRAAEAYPDTQFYGFDISGEMLKSAGRAVCRAGLTRRIRIAQADAASFEPERMFGVARFDRVFFSYTLSMIPPWREALSRALGVTAPGGSLHVVDFGQCDGLPRIVRTALFSWLRQFHVTPRAELGDVLAEVAKKHDARLTLAPRYRDYARDARLDMPSR